MCFCNYLVEFSARVLILVAVKAPVAREGLDARFILKVLAKCFYELFYTY